MLAARCNPIPQRRHLVVAKTGNDTTGKGTYDAPWLTVAKAVGQSRAGDIIFVKAGTYAEEIQFTSRSGKRYQPITVTKYPGDTAPVITTNDYWSVNIRGSDWIVIDGLTCTSPYDGIYISGSNNCTVRNNAITAGATGGGVGVHILSSQGPACNNMVHNNTLDTCKQEGIYVDVKTASQVAVDDNVVECNTITNTKYEGIQNSAQDGGAYLRPNRTIIRGNIISGGNGGDYAEMDLGGNGIQVQNNTVTNTLCTIGGMYVSKCVNGDVSGNTVTNTCAGTLSYGDGIVLKDTTGTTAKNNTIRSIYGAAASGVNEIGTSSGNTLSGNTKVAP